MPRCGGFASGSVLQTTMKTSPICPCEMIGFRAVHDVVIAVADRAGLDRGEVGAGAGLGHRHAQQDAPLDGAAEVFLLVRFGAEVADIGRADVDVQREHQCMGAQPGEFLHHDRVEEEVATGAAVLLGHARAEEALFAETPPGRAIGHASFVPRRDLRRDLLLGEAPELFPIQVVVLAVDVASHCLAPLRSSDLRTLTR
jgi:hypothetical protein